MASQAIAASRIPGYLGRKIDLDGFPPAQPYQCVDWASYFKIIAELLGLDGRFRGNAADIWNTFPRDQFDAISRTPGAIPIPGDIIIWNTRYGGGYGHIAVVMFADANGFTSADQNWNGPSVSAVRHGYDGVIGWLRTKGGASVAVQDTTEYKELGKANSDNASWALNLCWQLMHLRPIGSGELNNFITVAGRPGGMDAIWKQITNPDNPASEEHRAKIFDLRVMMLGRKKTGYMAPISDAPGCVHDWEIRQDCGKTLLELILSYEQSDEHDRYKAGLNDTQAKALQAKIDKAKASIAQAQSDLQ